MVALHATIGAELLLAQASVSKAVINIVRSHHERLDGSGYPNGWRQKRIAKAVRAVAVCDAFCAMTEDRPYEDAWPWQDALERLKSMPDQYDCAIVAAIGAMIRERGTSIQLHAGMLPPDAGKRASGVQRPRSAFFAARARHGVRLIQ